MEEKIIYQILLEKILQEHRRSHRYRRALESVHRVQLYPDVKQNNLEFKIFLEQNGASIYLTAEGNEIKKREYSPEELAEIIISTSDYKRNMISPKEIVDNLKDNITPALGAYQFAPFEDFLYKTND